jgi:thiol-disulfide isomerase/thioredoxin
MADRMNSRIFRPNARVMACTFVLCSLALSAQGQTPAKAPTASAPVSKAAAAPGADKPLPAMVPVIEGKTFDGSPFKLASLRGKVVLVMFWSTDCAVCRDKMPELRQNYMGWGGKPFELVAINTDARIKDVTEYENIISRTVPLPQRFVQLWKGEPGYKDTFEKPAQLPAAYLLDKSGKVVERFSGRIPPEVWDKIADLL